MKKILLIGGGGHAVSILEMARDRSIFLGYVDKVENKCIDIPYLGNDEQVLARYLPTEYEILLGCVYTAKVGMKFRQMLLEKYSHYSAPTLIAASAVVTPHSLLGEGTVVFERGVVNHAVLGRHCVLNTGAIIEHNGDIEDNVFIGPGAVIGGEVKIGKNTFIGSSAVIRNGITIQANTVIGMGAVVTKDIVEEGIYYGNPAKLIEK